MASSDEYILIIGVLSVGVGLVHFIGKQFYKSKCEQCNFCYGLIAIKRNAQIESNERIYDIEHGRVGSTDSNDTMANIANTINNVQQQQQQQH